MGANEKHAATYHGREYTPSTDVVLAAYMECEKRHVRTPDEKAISAFDRWLETVRAEAKAEALERLASEVHSKFQAAWIRGKAREYTHGPHKIVGAFAKPIESEADSGDQD